MFTIYAQWAHQTHRHLSHTNKVFNITRRRRRIDGIVTDIIQGSRGFFADKVTALLGHFFTVVVVAIAWDSFGHWNTRIVIFFVSILQYALKDTDHPKQTLTSKSVAMR